MPIFEYRSQEDDAECEALMSEELLRYQRQCEQVLTEGSYTRHDGINSLVFLKNKAEKRREKALLKDKKNR